MRISLSQPGCKSTGTVSKAFRKLSLIHPRVYRLSTPMTLVTRFGVILIPSALEMLCSLSPLVSSNVQEVKSA